MVNWGSILNASRRKWIKEFKPEQDLGIAYYKGTHHCFGTPVNEFFIDNIFLKLILAETDNLTFSNPKFIVSPIDSPLSSEAALESAKVLAIYLNYLVRSLDVQNEVSKVILEALVSPMSYLEVNSSKVKDPSVKNKDSHNHIPFVSWRRSDMILFDHTVSDYDFNRQRWVAIRELIPGEILLDKDNGYVNDPNMELDKGVWVWNVWDRFTKKIITVNSLGKTIKIRNWPAQFKRFPIIPMWFYPNPTKIFPMTYLRTVKRTQDYLNVTLSAIVNHVRKKGSIQLLLNTNKLTTDREQIGIDFLKDSILPISGSVADVAKIVDKGNIGADLFKSYQLLKDAETESLKLENSENSPGKLAKLKRFYRVLGHNLLAIAQDNAKDKTVALSESEVKLAKELVPSRVEGTNFLSLKQEDFLGEFNLEPIVELFQTKQARVERIVSLYKMIKDNPFLRQEKLLLKLMEEFGVDNAEEMLLSAEEVQQKQQAGIASQVKAAIAVDELKRKVDFAKTVEKEKTKRAQLSQEVEMKAAALKEADVQAAMKAKLEIFKTLRKGKG